MVRCSFAYFAYQSLLLVNGYDRIVNYSSLCVLKKIISVKISSKRHIFPCGSPYQANGPLRFLQCTRFAGVKYGRTCWIPPCDGAPQRPKLRAHARVAPRHHHRARHCPDPWLGHFVLLSGRAGRADRCRHRLVAVLGGERHVDRAVGGRADFAAGRSFHRTQGRPAGAAAVVAALCSRTDRDWARAELAGLPGRLGAARRRHGNGAVRRGVRGPWQALRRGSARANHQPHVVRRVFQHDLLAAQRLARRELGLARRMPDLRNAPHPHRAAASDGGDAAIQGRAHRAPWR